MSVADLSQEDLKELAIYLNEFAPVPKGSYDNDSEQYWYHLAVALRDEKDLGDEFKFNAHALANIGDKKNSAGYFLNLLVTQKLSIKVLIKCLWKIQCHKASNLFIRASPPIIKEQSRLDRLEVSYGEAIVLSVEAECHPGPPIYQWFKNQKQLLSDQTTKTLLLNNASTADTGYYHCRVTNQFINDPYKACVFSKYVHVTVNPLQVVNSSSNFRQEVGSRSSLSPPPQITHHPSSITAVLGNSVKLECKAEGAVCYDWFRNGTVIKSDQKDGMLLIESLLATDAGEYYCEAVNDHGRTRSRTVRLAIDTTIVQPQQARLRDAESIVFDEQPLERLEVHVGEEVVLTCKAHSKTGEPVQYEWFQVIKGKGVRVESDGSVYKAKTDCILGRRTIKIYCRVSLKNNPQNVTQSRITSVIVHSVWITKQPQSIDPAWIGGTAQLTCCAEGLGNIEYLWLKGSTKDGNFKVIPKANTGVLYFSRLKQKDWAYYRCQAFCPTDTDLANSDTVYVHPTIPSVKRTSSLKLPVIRVVKQPWSQVVKEGGRFRLLCKAVCSEDVPLSYQWYFCAKKIEGATKSALIRESARDSDCGPYYCEVRCPSNLAVKPVISKTARIELASSEAETDRPTIIGKNVAQFDQMAGEEIFLTKKNERYAREKIALLIGNQNYECKDLNDLRSPENDIKELGSLLEETLGFKVITLLDLTHIEMMRALEFFYEMLAIPGVYALFYYSGHGFTSPGGRNFLIPTNATVPLRYEHNIDVGTVTKHMRRKHSRAVVVLDCCRVESRVEAGISSEFDSFTDSEPDSDNLSTANYVIITSTQDGNPAFDGHATELSPATTPVASSKPLSTQQKTQYSCSNFNIAFREALREKRKLFDVFDRAMSKVAELDRGATRKGQRPTYSGSMLDNRITLHDDVFLDNSDHEPALEKILKLHEEVHYIPDAVLMEGRECLGKMSELVQLELSFSYDFTNVLRVHTQMYLLHGDKTSRACIKYDTSFLEEQGVRGVQTDCIFGGPLEDSDVGGQGETPQLVSTMIKISSIQRLGAKVLKLLLTLSLYREGEEVITKVCYEFPKKPLFANRH